MECPKCKRSLSAKKKTCMYCGALLDNRFSNHKTRMAINDNNTIMINSEHTEVDLKDLKESERQKVKHAIQKGEKEIIWDQQTRVQKNPATREDDEKVGLSFEKVLTVLEKMKDSYDDGQIEYGHYKQMVVEIVKGCLCTLDDHIRINFVVNEIKDSELSDYLDDEILKDLTAFVLPGESDKNTKWFKI